MKRLFFLIFLLSNITLIYSQIGISTQSPTRTLDVNGDVKVHTLSDLFLPNVPFVLATDTSGTLQKATPKDVLYSSGLYGIGSANDNWPTVYVGSKACQLEFTGRTSNPGAPDFTYKLFYKIGVGFKVISQNNIVVTPINATSFSISHDGYPAFVYQVTLSGNIASIKTTTNNGWSQGTFRSLPILD